MNPFSPVRTIRGFRPSSNHPFSIQGTKNATCRTQQCRIRHQHSSASNSHLPRIAQASLWETIFPKSVRESTRELFRPTKKNNKDKKSINPASYFIWIYLLIGSQAIRILGVQNDHKTYMRRADLKIAQLREVVEKLQRGEAVDVEKVLGTGDPAQEQEWEDALREIENEERIWQESKKKRDADRKRLDAEQDRLEAERRDASPVVSESAEGKPPVAPGFY